MIDKQNRLSNWSPEAVYHFGYKYFDVVVHCMYGSDNRVCKQSHIELYRDAMLYNCYTVKLGGDDINLLGPQNGLTLILYIGMHLSRLRFSGITFLFCLLSTYGFQ